MKIFPSKTLLGKCLWALSVYRGLLSQKQSIIVPNAAQVERADPTLENIYVWNRQIVRESLHLFCGRTLRNHRLKDSPKVMQEFSALVGNLTSNMLDAKLVTTSFFCSGSRGTKCFRIGIYLWHILTLLFLLQNLEGFVTLLILFVENKCMTPDAKFFPCYTNRSECSVPL